LERLETKIEEWYRELPEGKLPPRAHGILTLSNQLVTIVENMAADVGNGGWNEASASGYDLRKYVPEN
jgi:hypothetical protein